jgi:hypothetical protein
VDIGQRSFEVVVDEGAQVLECGGAKAWHFVEEMVVEFLGFFFVLF